VAEERGWGGGKEEGLETRGCHGGGDGVSGNSTFKNRTSEPSLVKSRWYDHRRLR
jgi:hypothetical protein